MPDRFLHDELAAATRTPAPPPPPPPGTPGRRPPGVGTAVLLHLLLPLGGPVGAVVGVLAAWRTWRTGRVFRYPLWDLLRRPRRAVG